MLALSFRTAVDLRVTHSCRRATVQSTRVARSRGTTIATGAINRIDIAATIRVRIARANLEEQRFDEAAQQQAARHSGGDTGENRRHALPQHQRPISAGAAPMAIRMPISRVREATRLERIP